MHHNFTITQVTTQLTVAPGAPPCALFHPHPLHEQIYREHTLVQTVGDERDWRVLRSLNRASMQADSMRPLPASVITFGCAMLMRSFRFIGLSVIIASMAVCARGIQRCTCVEFANEGARTRARARVNTAIPAVSASRRASVGWLKLKQAALSNHRLATRQESAEFG